MIRADDLTRKFGKFVVVDNVSFEIGKGEIVGLLGHNGAGKTTIMKMLTGYLEPTTGTIEIDGHDIEKNLKLVQKTIGYLPENCPVYPEMTVIDHLNFAAEIHGIERDHIDESVYQAIVDTDLTEKASDAIITLSRGYKQRVGVAQAILHRPKILVLDEPTNGLDPSQIQHMRDLIKRLAQNATIILSTHILQEVQAICDRVIVIHQGKKALDTDLQDLQGSNRLLVVVDAEPSRCVSALEKVQSVEGIEHLRKDETGHHYALTVNCLGVKSTAPLVANAVHENGFNLFSLYPEYSDLETVFAEINSMSQGARKLEGESVNV